MVISISKEHVLSKVRVRKMQMLFHIARSFLKKPFVLGKVLVLFAKRKKKTQCNMDLVTVS